MVPELGDVAEISNITERPYAFDPSLPAAPPQHPGRMCTGLEKHSSHPWRTTDAEFQQYLTKAKEQQESGALQSACRLIRDVIVSGTSGRIPCITPELYVVSDVSLQLGCFFLETSAACLKMDFEENPPANQPLSQAYLSQGQLKSPPATGSMEDFEEALVSFLKAIEISKNEPRFHFMVFNASVQYFQTVYPLLQSGRCLHLVPSLRQVVQGLEEVADEDHSWRAELMMHLIKCLVDSGEVEEAEDLAKTTEELIKCHAPHLYPRLFMIMVQHKLTEADVISEMSRKDINLAVIGKLQEFKNSLNEITKDELMKDSVELEEIFHLLVDYTKVSSAPENLSALHSAIPIQPDDRVAFLLELALLALQVKHQKVAANCLKELKLAREASPGQLIIMECVNSEINRLKTEAKINYYSKANVEALLKEIGRLDQLLQSAVRKGDPQAVQVVFMTLWRFCLPLLQHNLRKLIKTPLRRVARVLEDAQSSLLEMRCQVHSELAVIEEEEGCLEVSLTHLQKAILLDNGSQSQRLSWALHLLQLRKTLYPAPSRAEDKAAKLLQQSREMQPQDKKNIRPVLVAVGLHLGPDDFQIVLDGDNISKIPVSHLASGSVAQLSAKARHHSTCLQKVDGHLARQAGDTDNTERMKLWAILAKTARKQEVWDVCRAACRFCLLYDDGRWKISKADKTDESRSLEEESCSEPLHSCSESSVRDTLRLLAEIRFISAEATVQKLFTEGMQLNSPAVPPQERGVYVSEEDPDWVIYRDWIQALSTYATFNFLRAAELGLAIGESWVVANAAIYLWNYNSQLLASGDYQHLLPSFQNLVEIHQKMERPGNRALVVLLCNAVARGLIQPRCGTDIVEPTLPVDKGKNKSEKRGEKAAAVHGVVPDHANLENARKALEVCDYALHISTCNVPGEAVPIAARKQVVATWVHVKWLLQQQIGVKIDVKDECVNEGVSAMTRVLVGVEMLQSNRNPGHMEFSAPCLQTLVGMASECSWTDAVVELQVWSQLVAFCHYAKDHSLVLRSSKSALQLEEAAAKTINTMPCALYDLTAVYEMLSSAVCFRGLSLVHVSNGDLHAYRVAMKALLSSVSFAEKAKNPTLCVTAARHYWNCCVPLTQTPEGRRQLQNPLEKILNALLHTSPKYTKKQVAGKGLLTLTTQTPGSSKPEETGVDEDDLSLRSVIYSLLLQIRADKSDWKSGLQLLDKAERDMPPTKHSIPLLKSRILVKARLGESVMTDMEKLQEEGEPCSSMWHQVALCAVNRTQQLTSYQRAITSLQSSETQWERVNLLLEFGEWLHCHNFPKDDAQHQVQSAIDILLQLEPEQAEEAENKPKTKGSSEVEHEPLFAVEGLFTQNLSNLKGVQRLDCLVRAHTLLAVMTDRMSPEHQLNLLRAYTFVLQIWRVSMAGLSGISIARAKSPPQQPNESKKVKDKGKKVAKGKDTTPAEEKAKPGVPVQALPSSTKDWARYSIVDQTREIFRNNSSPDCINTQSITKQSQSLFYLNLLEKEFHSLSLDHMTLPILHLAEVIAHDLLDNSSLSYVYRLRILRTCFQLGLETHSPYQRKLPDLCRVQEKEQMECHKTIAFSKEREAYFKAHNQKAKMDERVSPGRQRMDMCTQDIWLDKAEVLLSMRLCQPARQLLAEAHLMASKSGDQKAMARGLLSLASLACEEQNHGKALILLEEDQALGGDEEFWYQLALNKVRAVAGQRHQDAQTKVDRITKITNQSCGALKQILEQQLNRVSKLTFLITSLEMRGAMECIRAFGGGEPGETLCSEVVQMLMTACDTFRECASSFTKLNYKKQAAEAHAEYAHGVRLVSDHTTDEEEKQRFLLDGLSHMELAVTVQEQVVLNAQSLLPPQEEVKNTAGIRLAARQRLLRLRLVLVEYCLAMLEERCAEDKCQALSRERKTSAEIAVEEFTRFTPEPGSVQQRWMSVGSSLGQVALGQLAAVSSHSSDNAETRARYLSLMGKCQRLMAVQEDPLYLCALWNKPKHKEAWSDPTTISVEEEKSEKEKDGTEQRKSSAKSAELQQRRQQAEQLLAQATKALTEAIDLCLQHKLPSSILADASINMLECQGQTEPAATGQYLALFQSCSSVAMMAEVLNSACTDTSVSQLSTLLNLRRKRLGFQEERPRSMLKGAEDSLNSLSKAFSQLTINPKHLQILAELPSNLKILLLQLSENGSELYGAFYEMTKPPENPKGKTTQLAGNLACSRVAKVSVSPQALLALREQVRALGQEETHAPLKGAGWQGAEGKVEASEKDHLAPRKPDDDEKLAPHFSKIVQEMEDYLKPLLAQFDSCLRLQDASVPCLEITKSKDKEDKGGSGKAISGECVVLLADTKLLELPLESLSILRIECLSSVSRDFSLQLLHSRLNREQPVDNKKETKGGIPTKGKGDQSQGIKVSYFRIIPYGTSLSTRMKEILETYRSELTYPWEGFMGSKETPSPSEMEQLLCKSSAFIYLGKERFMANVPPGKLAALNLSECRIALLFEQLLNNSSIHCHQILDTHRSGGDVAPEKPLETALLLSLCGVGCVVLNQWRSSLQQNTHNMATVLDNLLGVRQTSGQTIHTLRRRNSSEIPHCKDKGSHDTVLLTDSKKEDVHHKMALKSSAFNCVLYGLPHLIFK
ncbi:cilia- and flagella-associated protein 46 [Limanda limanda]|uniref:cilia- and flagella-associated protein 46 n=1 Tax=Limanda limanda TaxID=27771 RepID=UPI0029C975CD|nr:cilia- and flagella-associated protein 46 [Limanda limanda]